MRAGLMSARIKFPFTRDMRMLYEMPPPDRHPLLDVEAVEAILARYDKDGDDKNWSGADVLAAR